VHLPGIAKQAAAVANARKNNKQHLPERKETGTSTVNENCDAISAAISHHHCHHQYTKCLIPAKICIIETENELKLRFSPESVEETYYHNVGKTS
jgi:hypothetical protein